MALIETDFLVVGGGPVGSSVALELHKAGREVILIDAGASKAKICGEGLLPIGWAALEALGVAQRIHRKGPIRELVHQLPSADGKSMRKLTAPIRLPSFGVERQQLCQAFAEELESRGVETWRGASLRDLRFLPHGVEAEVDRPERVTISCRFLVGADGLHSKVRKLTGLLSEQPRSYARWGARIYFRQPEVAQQAVVVTLGDGVENYLTPLGDDLCGLAFLWTPERLGRPLPGEGPVWQRLLQRFPDCYRETLPPEDSFFGADKAIGPLQQIVTSPLHPSGALALVGDAAGYLDAVTGEGLCLGLLQARMLAALLVEGRADRYPAGHRNLKLRHSLVVHGLLKLLERPALRERVFSALHETPGMYRSIIEFSAEHTSWTRLLGKDLVAFLARLALPKS